jgi:hypothetical protein
LGKFRLKEKRETYGRIAIVPKRFKTNAPLTKPKTITALTKLICPEFMYDLVYVTGQIMVQSVAARWCSGRFRTREIFFSLAQRQENI